MKNWYIKLLEDNQKTKKRIKIEFIPLLNSIKLTGQYKFNEEWYDFTTQQIPSDFTPENLNNIIIQINNEMNLKIDKYNDLNEAFKLIETIEIK